MFLVFLAIVVFACMGRRFKGRQRSGIRNERFRHWASDSHRRDPSASTEERFEEWHRMTHAHEQADEPAPGPDDVERV